VTNFDSHVLLRKLIRQLLNFEYDRLQLLRVPQKFTSLRDNIVVCVNA
jgi:hypothetical protein